MPYPLTHTVAYFILVRVFFLMLQHLMSEGTEPLLLRDGAVKEPRQDLKDLFSSLFPFIVVSSNAPDVVDKFLYGSGGCAYTRSYGHTLLFVALSSILLYLTAFSGFSSSLSRVDGSRSLHLILSVAMQPPPAPSGSSEPFHT